MPLKGNISLAEQKEAGKKIGALLNIRLFHFGKSSTMSAQDFQMFRRSFQRVRHSSATAIIGVEGYRSQMKCSTPMILSESFKEKKCTAATGNGQKHE